MKKIILTVAISALLVLPSCMSVKLVGNVNMISTRNIEPKADYALLSALADRVPLVVKYELHKMNRRKKHPHFGVKNENY